MEQKKDDKTLEYTISNAVYNLANTQNDFISNSNQNYNCNISSKMNDAILLSEAYFMIEYSVTSVGGNVVLIPNFFLSMMNSINFNINSYSFQLNSIAFGRTFPMLVETMRYLTYENSDFNKYSKMSKDIFQNREKRVLAEGGVNVVLDNNVEFYPYDTYPVSASKITNYCILNLRDLLPVIDTINQVSGLLSFSFVLNYNKEIHSPSVNAFSSFTIEKINFHYPVRTFHSQNAIDIDLNYFSTMGVLQGQSPQNLNYQLIGGEVLGSINLATTVSNIQLSTNQIFKLMIFPVFTKIPGGNPPAISNDAGKFISIYKNNDATPEVLALSNIPTNSNSLFNLLTPPGSVGSQLFGYSNIKIITNGQTISPSNSVVPYQSGYSSDYYPYYYSFNQDAINKQTKPNLWFDFEKYRKFKPIVVDISNETSKNAFNSLSFSFNIFNQFNNGDGLGANGCVANIDIKIYYTVLNLVVLNSD